MKTRFRFVVLLTLTVLLLSTIQSSNTVLAASIIPVSKDSAGALALAQAMVAYSSTLASAQFVAVPPSGTPNGTSDALSFFPTHGTSFSILTSGNVLIADDPNTAGNSGSSDSGPSLPGRGSTAFDVTILQINLNTPAGANCLRLDFAFYSEEFPEYVGSAFNDAFIAELDQSTWVANSTIQAPDNFAFDQDGNVISINSTGQTRMNDINASSTASVQAKQELTSKASANAPSTQQENNPGCNAEPCSITPSSSTSTHSLQSFTATGSVTGITDPTLIPNASVYDFSADAPYSAPTSFPGGTFSGDRQVRVVGSGWATWNPQIDGKHVLFAFSGTVDVLFTSPQIGVVVKAEPNNTQDWFNITIEAFDSSNASLGSFTRSINGNAGAAFLGVLSTSDDIAKITLSSEPDAFGFAFSDITYGSSSCSGTPDTFEPDDTPTAGSVLGFIADQRHTLCPQSDVDWAKVTTNGPTQPNLLVETFDLEPDSIHPNGNTKLTVLDESLNQIGISLFRGLGPFPGSPDILQSSRVVWHPATGGVFNIKVIPEMPLNEQEGSGYSLRLANPSTDVDPVDQGSWAPTKVNVPTVWRSGNVIYFTQYFTYEQAELDALNAVPATLAWEFRRPGVDTNTGIEITDGNVDYGDYWQNVNGVCVGEYWTNLPNHSHRFTEESNPPGGCQSPYPNNPLAPDNEEFELYVDKTSQLVAGKAYYITIKFYIHPQYLNNDYQFYISKAEYCELWDTYDFFCNILPEDDLDKLTANLIEGYLQPAP